MCSRVVASRGWGNPLTELVFMILAMETVGTVYYGSSVLVCKQLGVRQYLVGGKTMMFQGVPKLYGIGRSSSVIVP